MSVNSTLLICVALNFCFAFFLCGDSINIYRRAKTDRFLNTFEVCAVVVVSLFSFGFGAFGYRYFHDKDSVQIAQEFKKIVFYFNFFACHSSFVLFFLATAPVVVWDCVDDPRIVIAAYITIFPLSLLMAVFSYAVQLPNFFDRHQIVVDETGFRKN